MQIIRERPSQRRHHRVTAPLKATLPSGQALAATNWSLGGIRFDGLTGSLPAVGETLALRLDLPFQGFDISFDVEAKTVWSREDTATAGMEFLPLSERARDLMSHFIEDLIRGKMASVDETILRIDVPVTPISTKPDANPIAGVPVRRWPIRVIVMTSLYLVLGTGLFGYLGILLWSKTMRMEVRSAVVSAPLQTLNMPIDGTLVPVAMTDGEIVSKGDTIARIDNPRISEALQAKRIDVEQAREDLARAEEKYRLQARRMSLYKIVKKTDLQIAEARAESARQSLRTSDAAFERMTTLRAKGLVEAFKYEEAELAKADAEARLKETESEVERAAALDTVSDRVFFNNKEFVADLDMLALEVDVAASMLKRAIGEFENLKLASDGTSIRAPFDGRIVRVMQEGEASVLRNQPVATIEKIEDPRVTAFLTQDEVLSVAIGAKAKVFLPSLGHHIAAIVERVDRNSAFLNSEASRYEWSEGKQRTAAVQLKLLLGEGQSREVAAGLPAIVIFPKVTTSDIYHGIGSLVEGITGSEASNVDGRSI